jgi:hypothetical protein
MDVVDALQEEEDYLLRFGGGVGHDEFQCGEYDHIHAESSTAPKMRFPSFLSPTIMPTVTRPNILWFSLEDTSPRFGCYGDRLARTPNLDRVGGEIAGPVLLQLHSATQGASIGWTTGEHWQLYTGPIRLEPGATMTLRAKAIRIGYRESAERAATFVVR